MHTSSSVAGEITASLDEFKHINIPKFLLLSMKSCGVFFPWEVNAAEAPLASPQSSLPHRSLLAPRSGWQVCHGEASTTLAHRGAVLSWQGGRHSKQLFLSGSDVQALVCGWSAALIVRQECKSLLLFWERGWNHPQSEEEGNLLCCCDCHWGVLLGEGGRRTGGRS